MITRIIVMIRAGIVSVYSNHGLGRADEASCPVTVRGTDSRSTFQ